ncbi:MAG TPA: ROK family protein [Pseudosphingobacterium sp.]|nr:ROK family protein [Pseudosphingobacterium sp.]
MTIGVDIGGTNIRAGLVSKGTIISQNQLTLKNKHSMDAMLAQLMEVINPLTSSPYTGIGIGVPSVVDTVNGIVYDVANIPAWKRVELKQIVQERFQVPVRINNDVNCFVLGEYNYGIAKGFGSLVGITLGTGMGSGLIFDHVLYTGHNCGAGEIGLMPYLDKTLEDYVGSQFFIAKTGKSAEELWRAALTGEKQAIALWEEFGWHLGKALKIVMYAYDPEAIVLGGSISQAYAFFEKSMLEVLKDFEYPNTLKQLKILVSQKANISLLGAASLITDS